MSAELPIASWVAGTSAHALPQRRIDGTPLFSLVLTPAQTQRLWQRMSQAGESWRALSLQERVGRLAALSAVLRRDGAGRDAQRLAQSTGLSLAGMHAAWDVTFSPWTEAALLDLLQAEDLQAGAVELRAASPRRLVHVLAGNVLPPTWSLLMRGWLLGAAQWLRPSAREPLFASLLLRRVAELDPPLAAMTAVTWWPHLAPGLDAMADAVLGPADVVTAHGDDVSIAAIEAALHRLPGARRFVGYGSRWSCAVLGSQDLTQDSATRLAVDVVLFDQQGCLSPTRVFVPADAPVEEWCACLARALAEQQRRLPRGEPGARGRAALRHYVERMRLAQVQGKLRFWSPASRTDWSVALTACDAEWESPLDRHVLVHPLRSATDLRRGMVARLTSVQGVATGRSHADDSWCREILEVLQPTLVAPVGSLQQAPPSWRQDHRRPLRSLMLDGISES